MPTWATNNLWPETDGMSSGLKSFVDSVIIILSTGYTIGCLSAIGCAAVPLPNFAQSLGLVVLCVSLM